MSGTWASGSQQQWVSRNADVGYGGGGVWNMVWVGSTGAPSSHCSNNGDAPETTVDVTPTIAEKPYLVKENGRYILMRPRVEFNKVGHTAGW